jgi:predicted TIM-barrel fold metal-dependent hydrolase
MPRIDVHLHMYPRAEDGRHWKTGYEIWEYGPHQEVVGSLDDGTADQASAALARGGFAHAVALNLFVIDMQRRQFEASLPPQTDPAGRAAALAEFEHSIGDRYVGHNRWLMDAVAGRPEITGFPAADPWALPPDRNVAHLREMAERGARGIKIHPVLQRFEVADPRMLPVYAACSELGFAVLSHTGPAHPGQPSATPADFAPVLRDFPGLTVILAHLGGAAWRSALEVARAFPNVTFDLCEIIDWAGAPGAPTPLELAGLVRDIGPDRVLLGSDYPWYEPAHSAELVEDLPLLSRAEKDAVLGENAARILRLPV